MGSSSSAPVRQVLSEDEGTALINNDIQTGQDTVRWTKHVLQGQYTVATVIENDRQNR